MLEIFTDPLLRAPTFGCLFMAMFTSLVGCLVFLQKRSLVGEALSHASYPGAILAGPIGAFISAAFGLFGIHHLEKKSKIKSDAALCFILSVLFGLGVLFASRLQFVNPVVYAERQVFLFGQAATMMDVHIYVYGGLAFGALLFFLLSFRALELYHFDRELGRVMGVRVQLMTSVLLILAIIVGMRSVGVILISAMLIAPPVAARQWVNRLGPFLALSSIFGMASGVIGNAVAFQTSVPTGPAIVLTASSFAFCSLVFSPTRGALARALRRWRFAEECAQENALKDLIQNREVHIPFLRMRWMTLKSWIADASLTKKGEEHARRLIHLHRLWEAYIIHMGQGMEKGHQSAEEMEHILNDEIEHELERLLAREVNS